MSKRKRCRICDRRFTRGGVMTHMVSGHFVVRNEPLTCICGERFQNLLPLLNHVNSANLDHHLALYYLRRLG